MCLLFLRTSANFVFPLGRNAVPDISHVPLQATIDVFVCPVLEPVVENHVSVDSGSSFESLIFVSASRRCLCFQVCISCAQGGCLVLCWYTAFRPYLATFFPPVLCKCTIKRDLCGRCRFLQGHFHSLYCDLTRFNKIAT